MTTLNTKLADGEFAADTQSDDTFLDAVRGYARRVRGGDMILPAILGLIVLFIVFGLANDRFVSALNLANLVAQAGSICVLAMGLVFVLLLGDIDLLGGGRWGLGVRDGADDRQPRLAVVGGNPRRRVHVEALIGLAIGVLCAKLGIPSFVVTLAFFLGLQGVTLKLIGEGGWIVSTIR